MDGKSTDNLSGPTQDGASVAKRLLALRFRGDKVRIVWISRGNGILSQLRGFDHGCRELHTLRKALKKCLQIVRKGKLNPVLEQYRLDRLLRRLLRVVAENVKHDALGTHDGCQ